ncbi:MAG: GtrA family protein [Anaerolineae bacterium]|nr:GtrA family protein [Anaerolineae bacterium]
MSTVTTKSSSPESRGIIWLLTYPFVWWDRLIPRLAGRISETKAKEVERFLRFATVGIVGAIIDFGVLNLLQGTILAPVDPYVSAKVALATGAAFVAAVSSNFVWNRYWTYPDSRTRSIRRQWVQFFLVSLVGLTFRLVWVRGLFTPFGNLGEDVLRELGAIDGALSAESVKRVGTNIAQFWAVWIVMVWNFFANRYWTYNDVE